MYSEFLFCFPDDIARQLWKGGIAVDTGLSVGKRGFPGGLEGTVQAGAHE